MICLPDDFVQNLIFKLWVDIDVLNARFENAPYSLNHGGDFENIDWLNTPGPIYTTFTDNCGTGQLEAINNVGGDENYHEVIFKQPVTIQELTETITSAIIDPFGAYYFDGNLNWTVEKIVAWWHKSEDRVNYIVNLYDKELALPIEPNYLGAKPGDTAFAQFNNYAKPLPENYKAWLDFYQFGIEDYLEWYIEKICGVQITLMPFVYDWAEKERLDYLYMLKFLGV